MLETIAARKPAQAEAPQGPPIHIIATTLEGTRCALAAARVLAEATDSGVYVLARQAPPLWPAEGRDPHLEGLAGDIRHLPEARFPRLEILPCLAARVTDLMQLLGPGADVFVGGRSGRWWLTAEQRVARDFARLGCRVTFVLANE